MRLISIFPTCFSLLWLGMFKLRWEIGWMPWEQANSEAGVVPQDPKKFVGEKKERKERKKEGRQAGMSRKETTLGAASHRSPPFVSHQREYSFWGASLLYLLSHSTVNYSARCLVPGDKEPCLLLPGSASASVWMTKVADVESTSPSRLTRRFFTWGPRNPNWALGDQRKPFILEATFMYFFFFWDLHERLHIIVYNAYHSWDYLKGLITFLGRVLKFSLFCLLPSVSTYMWCLDICNIHKTHWNQ